MSTGRAEHLLTAACVALLLALSGCGGGGGAASGNGPTVAATTGSSSTGGTAPEGGSGAARQGIAENLLPVAGQPPDHDLEPGYAFTLQPGTTGKHGAIQYSCPAGGAACVLSVADDGTVVYERGGGIPFIDHPLPMPGELYHHGLGHRSGTYTVQPGATERHGNVDISCPAGGPACVLIITPDDILIYALGGGKPAIAHPSLRPGVMPYDHGLARGASFTIQPGVTERHGNVEFSCPAGGPACMLSVTGGRLVQYHPAGGIPSPTYIPPPPVEEVHATFIPPGPDEDGTHFRFHPALRYWLYLGVSTHDGAPVMAFDGKLHVGADVAPPEGALGGAGTRGAAALSKGEVRDGVGATEVLDYLKTMARGNIEDLAGLQKWNAPQDVRIVGTDTSERFIGLTAEAVRIVNAALPFTQRLKLRNIHHPISEELAEHYHKIGLDRFFVRFVPKSDPWWSGAGADEIGSTRLLKYVYYIEERQRWEVAYGEGALRADVLIDPDAVASFSDREITHLLVHELLHAMGFMSHTDPQRFDSTLSETYIRGTEPRSLIHPIDREGLLAAYSRFKAGTLDEMMTPESLGPWTDTSFHFRGDLGLPSGDVAFGVAFRNGLPQPWAFGPTPTTDVVGNATLSGTATWEGALVGITPFGEAVTGDSALVVDLSKVRHPAYGTEPDGTLNLTGIRFEDGESWGDGDLRYAIEVSGNRFHRVGSPFVRYGPADPNERPHDRASGEDFGVVTAAFFGTAHEGMGGVLERHDLSAAFGGKRTRSQ